MRNIKSRKPKIVFLIPRLGITDRGTEVTAYELAKGLGSDFKIEVWNRKSASPSHMVRDLQSQGIKIRSFSCIAEEHLLARLFYFKPLKVLIDKFQLNPMQIEMLTFSFACLPRLLYSDFDVIFPCNGVWGAFVSRLVRVIRKNKFVYASHGGIEPAIALQKPNLYVAIHRYSEKWLKKDFPDLNVVYISSGANLEDFSPKGAKIKLDLPRPIYLTVSALTSQKRVDLTIKAVAKLKKGSLLIIGDGPSKEELGDLANKLLGEKRYRILGIDHKDIPKYYRSVDVFTHSAPQEKGWGLVHLEAIASGLPIVANKEENLEEFLGKDGFLCDVEDTNDYSQALEKAAKSKVNTRRPKLIEKVKRDHSWKIAAGRYREEILKLLE